jgi:transcription elongation factor Elf1
MPKMVMIPDLYACPRCGEKDTVTMTPDDGENSITWCACGLVFVQDANKGKVNHVVYDYN